MSARLTVGVFGPPDDPEVRALCRRLAHRGVEPWAVDLSAVPRRARLSWGAGGPQVDGRPLLEMGAAYLRRVGFDLPEPLRYRAEPAEPPAPGAWQALSPEARRRLADERQSAALRQSVLLAFCRRRPLVNPPQPQNLHRLKIALFHCLGRAGLAVPRWGAGSQRGELTALAKGLQQRHGGAVEKPLAGIYKTFRLTEARLAAHPFGRRPALYQRLVAGPTVRCYLLGGRLLSAARIVAGDTVDSSRSQTGIEVVTLAPEAEALALAAARALDLPFLGLDLLLDAADGERPYLIDCNLAPMFVAYGKLSGCDVAGSLADHLIALAADEPWSRPRVLDLVDRAKDLLRDDPELAALLRGPGSDPKKGPR